MSICFIMSQFWFSFPHLFNPFSCSIHCIQILFSWNCIYPLDFVSVLIFISSPFQAFSWSVHWNETRISWNLIFLLDYVITQFWSLCLIFLILFLGIFIGDKLWSLKICFIILSFGLNYLIFSILFLDLFIVYKLWFLEIVPKYLIIIPSWSSLPNLFNLFPWYMHCRQILIP